MRKRKNAAIYALFIAFCLLLTAMLACQGNAVNMGIVGTPRYICPSSTPRATHTMLPPDPPTYPPAFAANLNYYHVDPLRSYVNVQYMAQNVGAVQVSASGRFTTGTTWFGGSWTVAITGNYSGLIASFPVYIPPSVISAVITISSSSGMQSFAVTRYFFPLYAGANPPPCCLPNPVFPPPRPTYTPYPTPTLFQILAPGDFYLDDPVYNFQPPIQVRLRLKSPIKEGQLQFIIPLLAAASWTLEVTNIGQVEYDFLGAGYTFITGVEKGGEQLQGVWAPSHAAAQFLGITEQAYGPHAIQPGQTITVTVAAWIPAGWHVSRVSFVLDPYHSGDPGWATFEPGSPQDRNQIHWVNKQNPICKGEIQYP